jgi:ABC-type phosphate/phosphonate transport system substrate-binding protein
MKITKKIWVLLFVALVYGVPSAFAQDLIFTAPPREKPEAGEKTYGPLVEHLSKLLGKKVVYVHPKNWLNYQREMRDDKYDIVFDGPHFISWRMEHLGHDVLVKLPGTLDFYLLAEKDDAEINQPADLVGKNICCISPPNLSSLSILATFPNPVQQPVLKGVTGGMGGVFTNFNNNKLNCRAWILRTNFYKKKIKDEDRAKMKIIYATKPIPNQGISVSKRLNDKEKNMILQSLTLGDGIKASQPIIKRFGGNAKSFVPAKTEEYRGHNLLLEGVIFGW